MATEGTLESIIDRIVAIQETITGVTTAYKEPPDALQTAQLPAFVNRPTTRLRPTPIASPDTLMMVQTVEMTLYLRQLGLGLTNQSIGGTAWALIDAVEAAFATNPRLALATDPIQNGLFSAEYQGCNGYEIRTYPEGSDATYTALVFTLVVTTGRVIPPLS